VLRVLKLKKYYGRIRGIEDVSFEIDEGVIYGLIGPNGAGKTTTIRTIIGMIKADEGEVYIGDFKVPDELDRIKHEIGYVPGEVNFYGDMKVGEFLEFNRRFYKNVDTVYEKELIETLGIEMDKRFRDLSHGNKKKVAILQALVHKPKYLIMDEPTNGLDPLVQQRFYQLLERHRKMGAVILFSSHILSEVERICQRFGMIKDGVVIKDGDVDSLRKISYKIVRVYGLRGELEEYRKSCENGVVTFHVPNDDMRRFLQKVCELGFEDIEVKSPTLEDIFLEYYK